MQYRHTGYYIHSFKVPKLVDKSEVERGKEMKLDPLWMTEAAHLMMSLGEGEEAALRFNVYKSKSKYVWGVSYSVIDGEKNTIAEGKLPPGEESVVKFKAPKAGFYTLVLTPGHYGRCVVLSSTVPYALWTGSPAALKRRSKFEVPAPGGTVYFFVPEGVKEFGVAAWCEHGRGHA